MTVLLRPPEWAAAEEALRAETHSAAGRSALQAPVELHVAVGELVEKGQVIVVFESMKTEGVACSSRRDRQVC